MFAILSSVGRGIRCSRMTSKLDEVVEAQKSKLRMAPGCGDEGDDQE